MRAVLFAVTLAVAVGCGAKKDEGGGGEKPAGEIEVTAQELVEAYRANTVSADAKFKDKRLRVKGVDVEKVGRSVEGNPVISSKNYVGANVGGRFEQCRIIFGFPDKDDPAAGKVSLGLGAVLDGTCRGKTLERPQGQDEIPSADWYIVLARTSVAK